MSDFYDITHDQNQQSIGCLTCGAAERIAKGSPRLPGGKWPAWTPGLQSFPCPTCGERTCWATEPGGTDSRDVGALLDLHSRLCGDDHV